MISFEQARQQILAAVLPLGKQPVRLDKLSGSYLAEPVVATGDLPGFDNSAVDGFGVLAGDVERASEHSPAALKLAGVIQAGDAVQARLSPGFAIKILTGALVPATVEAVVMKEFCRQDNGSVLVHRSVSAGENIRRQGAEFRKGQQILAAGVNVTPPVVGLLAMLGHSSFPVFMKPKVAVVSTGNELVKPGRRLAAGQIYDANTYALAAAVSDLDIDVCRTFFTRDEVDSTRNAINQALRESDVLVTAGGISVGDCDIVKDVLDECGVKGLFWRIAIKPGKPVYFGVQDSKNGSKRKLVFGLPGNPVSALVTFHQLVRPALLKMMGASGDEPAMVRARLCSSINKSPGRLEFVRALLQYENGLPVVSPVLGQDSHMLGGLSQANCLINFPADSELLDEGSDVELERLWWSR